MTQTCTWRTSLEIISLMSCPELEKMPSIFCCYHYNYRVMRPSYLQSCNLISSLTRGSWKELYWKGSFYPLGCSNCRTRLVISGRYLVRHYMKYGFLFWKSWMNVPTISLWMNIWWILSVGLCILKLSRFLIISLVILYVLHLCRCIYNIR